MLREKFALVPTTFKNDDIEEGKYTVIYTDVGEIQIFKPLEETMEMVKECKEKGELFKTKRLDEYSATLQHFGEFVIDLTTTKVLGYKEHHLVDNLKLQRELKEKAEKEKLEPKK